MELRSIQSRISEKSLEIVQRRAVRTTSCESSKSKAVKSKTVDTLLPHSSQRHASCYNEQWNGDKSRMGSMHFLSSAYWAATEIMVS